jgi:ATP-dependent phosphofructokinase / diphosphate-dependent phosphofructokinase
MGLRVGILTAGGDCPGLNAVIRAVVRRASADGGRVLGIRNGWQGLLADQVPIELTRAGVRGILPRGGTILGTSRVNPLETEETVERLKSNFARHDLQALIVVGGDGSLRTALELWRAHRLPVVGVPKTIDNDIGGTDFTFGFDTAVGVVTEAIDRLHSTAESHHRVMVVEVMGRHAGWIAAYGGIAGGADVVLVPEHPFSLLKVCEFIRHRESQGSPFSIIVAAEDARPVEGEDFLSEDERGRIYRHERLGGIGDVLAREIESCTGIQTRVTKLGYVQRGGTPSAFDRVLATRFGVKAYEMALAGEWGRMAALRCAKVVSVPLEDAVRETKLLDEEIYHVAEIFFG